MRGSKALFTTDEVEKKFAENVCNIAAAYSCIFNHPDDNICIMNKMIYTDCMNNMSKKIQSPEEPAKKN
jgi:hypothetical protein